MSRDGWLGVLRAAASGFRRNHGVRLAASLAFFSLFSLAPLLLVTMWAAGLAVGEERAREVVLDGIGSLLGQRGVEGVGTLLDEAGEVDRGAVGTLLTVGTLLVGAVAAFVELKDALNEVWGAKRPPGREGVLRFVRERVLSAGTLLTVAFLSLSSLVVTAGLAAFGEAIRSRVPVHSWALFALNAAIALAATTVLFAILFKFLPDAKIAWRDTWLGAAATGAMFLVGQLVIGTYLSRTPAIAVYGSAGSLVVLLLWLFYSAIVFFLGAELVRAWSDRFGAGVRPQRGAEGPVRKLRERAT